MNMDNTVEYNSLSWVKDQLDDVLSDAQSNLNEYIEEKSDEYLENCIEHLQLIYGTLQMVEVYGASMLTEEMQRTTEALLKGDIESEHDTYDVLMRAMLQLPDYLEGIQSGKKDAPITLMPLINDLRAARKEGLLTESALFSPDIVGAELSSDAYNAAAIVSGKLQDETRRLRTHYQLGLLDFIRNKKERVGLQRIKAVLNSLEKVSSEAEVRRIWMVVAALVEGLINQGIDTNLSIKMLMGAVDRQLKLILDVGEEAFAKQYSKELVTNVLYYVGMCTVDSKAISAVQEAYHLADLIPKETDESAAAIGGLNADLFDTVSKGITEDLMQVKDTLELFMHSSEHDLEQLGPVVEQLGKIADTYGMLGMGATRQSIMKQRDILQHIVNKETEINEQTVLGVASELLNAESELKDFIASRSGFVDINRNTKDQVVPAAEYRQVVFTVVSEGLKNFGEAKEAILAYISGSDDKKQLKTILQLLEEVRGVSLMLPIDRIEEQIEKLQNFISVALLNNDHKVSDDEQDSVADVVTSIEYFFEALREGRPGVEQGLKSGDEAAAKLDKITHSYGGATTQTFANEIEDASEELALDVIEVEATDVIEKPAVAEVKTVKKKAELKNIQTADVVAQDITQYEILSDDADEEIVEIFIEEAVEVLGELHEHLPQWRSDPDNEEALAVVRRSFHTLKGSGRLLGAELIGEFSWKFENMLNRVIDNKINISDALFYALDEALNVLPQLIEQLKGNREPVDSIAQLMSVADAIAEGRDVSLDAADAAVENEQSDSDDTAEIENIEVKEDDSEISLALDTETAIEGISLEDSSDDELTIEDTGLDIFELAEESDVSLPEIDVSDSDAGENDEVIEIIDAVENDEIDLELVESPEIPELDAAEAIDIPELDAAEAIIADEEEITALDNTAEEMALAFDEADSDVSDDEETLELAIDGNNYDIEIEEQDEIASAAAEALDIDPMLLQIYYDESQGHIAGVRKELDECELQNKPLQANKNLVRAFHTLYGSARTAEIEAIAELSGIAEKYVKVKQESGNEDISADVTSVLRQVEQTITEMLSEIADGKLPVSDKNLHEKLNKAVQQEMQSQLQQSWQDKEESTEDVQAEGDESLNADESEVSAIDDIAFSDETNDVTEVAASDDIAEAPEEAAEQVEVQPAEEAQVHMPYGDIDNELIDIFLEEAVELLENCEDTINEIRSEPNATEHIHQLQRNMHTLKGGARMADLSPVGDLTHNLESLVVLVNENKVNVNKVLFDLLQESLDALNGMLANVKKRQPLAAEVDLNNRIEMLMRGEIEEKRSVERFDVELSEIESEEEVDISELLPELNDAADVEQADESNFQRRANDQQEERPHWGERVSDVNFQDSQEQVRVRSDLLNNLVNYAGEVNIFHARMGKQITDFGFNLSELSQTVVRLKEQLRKLEIETEIQIRSGYEKEAGKFDDGFDPLEMDQYSTLQQLTRSLSETAGDVDSINEILNDITRDSETLLMQESRISTDLQEGLMRTRMVRFGGLTSRLRRIVRQVARELGKEVEVEINGDSSEVDRTVLDRIIAPLEHLLRNAVAHGIETPDARKALGKDETGRITIDVQRQGTDVVLNVKDDGAGIDIEKIRAKAVKQGFISEDSNLSDHDVLQLILQSGFSTADEVTQVAGRGVGMDVVDSEIKQLGGILDIDTTIGKGTEFHIRLPLTLAINQALLVSAADDVFAVPLASIEGVVRITGLELQRFYDSENTHYEFNGIEYELKHLGGLLTGRQSDYSKQLQLFPVLLVHVGDQHFALHVEDLIGRREIVVKPVGVQIGSVHGIAGATILADGRVVLILEMSSLVVAESIFKHHAESDTGIAVEEAVEEDGRKTIMVVDDSITIRKITERMLKRYGVDVVLAKDGVDATNQLQDSVPDLMLLDIEMPRMDGFEVASYVRNDDRLKNIPIIMITSRTGSKHKDKAMGIGVNEYLGKPFQEEELIKDINKILNTSY